MAKNNQSKLASKRAKAGMNEVLVEGAASMSGQAAKQIANAIKCIDNNIVPPNTVDRTLGY